MVIFECWVDPRKSWRLLASDVNHGDAKARRSRIFLTDVFGVLSFDFETLRNSPPLI
jgi:hypothetical protein